MKVGIVANIMQDKPLAKALDYFRNIGIQTIEPGCGGYAGKSHVNPAVLLGDKEKMDGFKRTIADSGLTISALSCHGNPIHPDQGIAAAHDGDMRDAVKNWDWTRLPAFPDVPETVRIQNPPIG